MARCGSHRAAPLIDQAGRNIVLTRYRRHCGPGREYRAQYPALILFVPTGDDAQDRSTSSHGSAVLLTALVRTTIRAQPRYLAMLAQGGPRRTSPEAYLRLLAAFSLPQQGGRHRAPPWRYHLRWGARSGCYILQQRRTQQYRHEVRRQSAKQH